MNAVDAFMDATSVLPVPDIYRKWAALSLVSALLSRRTYTSIGLGLPLFANLFVILVGSPTIGKSLIQGSVNKLLIPFASQIVVGPSSVTPQKLIEKMGETFGPAEGEQGKWSWMQSVSEIGTFVKKADIPQLQELAVLWDCPDVYQAATISRGEDTLYYPYLVFLACAQPEWMNAVLSIDTMNMGLPSRVIFVLEETKRDVPLFQDVPDSQYERVAGLLKPIAKIAGKMPWTREAQKVLVDWKAAGMPTEGGKIIPAEGPIEYYLGRRLLHVGKLAMLWAAAEHPMSIFIEADDVRRAMETLFEVERNIPRVFAGIGGNPYRMREEDVLRELKKRGTISEETVYDILGKNFPTIHSELVMKSLMARGALVQTNNPMDNSARRYFKVRA